MAVAKKKNTGLIWLIIAVLMGLAAAGVAVVVVRQATEQVPAVIAVRDIPAFKRIAPEDVQLEQVPLASLRFSDPQKTVPLFFQKLDASVIGKVVNAPILKGQVLYKEQVTSEVAGKTLVEARLNAKNDAMKRAFALPFNPESGVGGEIRDGDRVDIIASVKIDTGAGSVGVGKIVAQNVEVIRMLVGQDGKGTMIVALTPEEIENISFALTSGTIRYALRPALADVPIVETPGVTGASWLEKYGFILPGMQQKTTGEKITVVPPTKPH